MKKELALERLSVAENEIKELRKIIESSDKPQKITDRVKTWEDVCEIKGINPVKSLPYPNSIDKENICINNYFMAIKITEVLNEGWEPNWKDTNEYKWYMWWNMNDKGCSSGFGFGHSYAYYWNANTIVSSRLCFKSKELTEYAAKQFLAVYRNFLTK